MSDDCRDVADTGNQIRDARRMKRIQQDPIGPAVEIDIVGIGSRWFEAEMDESGIRGTGMPGHDSRVRGQKSLFEYAEYPIARPAISRGLSDCLGYCPFVQDGAVGY